MPLATATPRILSGPSPSPTPDAISNVEEAARAVVFIQTPNGTGSGFVFDDEGHILTNAHVVESFRNVAVRYNDQFEFLGTVINTDVFSDLAVIKVDTRIPLEQLSLGDSSEVRLGQAVNVIGFPFGTTLGSEVSISEGILSSRREFSGVEYLQTDAAINPGNSGGPLVNSTGEVIGVNTSRLEEVAGRAAQGIGLAITSNYVARILPTLLETAVLRPTATRTRIPTATPTPSMAEDWLVYRNDKHGYSIGIPPGWSLNDWDETRVTISRNPADTNFLIAVFPNSETNLDDLADQLVSFQEEIEAYSYVHISTEPFVLADGNAARLLRGRVVSINEFCPVQATMLVATDGSQTYEVVAFRCEGAPVSAQQTVEEALSTFGLDVDVVYPTPIPAPTATATPSPTATPSATPRPAPTATPTVISFYELAVEVEPSDGAQVFVSPWDNQLEYEAGTLVQLTAFCFTGDPNWFGDKPEYGDATDETIFMFMDKDRFVLLTCQ